MLLIKIFFSSLNQRFLGFDRMGKKNLSNSRFFFPQEFSSRISQMINEKKSNKMKTKIIRLIQRKINDEIEMKLFYQKTFSVFRFFSSFE